MKIAIIGIKGLPARYGADRVVEAIVQHLSGRHEFTAYCSRRETPSGVSIPGIRLIRLPYLPGKFFHMLSVDLLAAIHALIWGNYDLVHVHHIEASFIIPLLRIRYKIVATAHGRMTLGNKWGKLSTSLIRKMEFPFTRYSNIATSVSLPDAEHLSRKYRRPVQYIPNGINIDLGDQIKDSTALFSELGIQPGKYLLFIAGRIIPIKGAHLLLQAFARLEQDFPLLIVGDASQSPDYTRELKQLANERVLFVPFIAAKEVLFTLIRHCYLLIFPSTQEAMSMTLLESAATGAPVLCSDIPANKAILPDQAVFFSSGEVDDLERKLRWALAHPQEIRIIGDQAQARVMETYNWNVITKIYEQAYLNVALSNI